MTNTWPARHLSEHFELWFFLSSLSLSRTHDDQCMYVYLKWEVVEGNRQHRLYFMARRSCHNEQISFVLLNKTSEEKEGQRIELLFDQ